MKLIARFRLRWLLLVVSLLTMGIGTLAFSTRDFRKRLQIEANLRAMGAYHVGFNDRSDPIWISVKNPSIDSRIVEYGTIETIDLSGARIDDQSLQCIAELERLRMIDLCNSRITDEQLDLLSRSGSLEILRLNGSAITDAAIPSLAAIASLKMVDLSNTQVTKSGLAELAKLRSDITVRQ